MVADVSTALNPKVSSRVSTHQNPKRPPLLPSEADNGPRRPKQREVTSRYLSSASSSSSATSSSYSSSSRRFPSPVVSRTVPMTPAPPVAKRSQSVERRRPATPRPRTPNNAGEMMSTAAKALVTSARSLSVSFQGESFSLPISKAKPAPVANNTSNTRKSTPERRKATPVRDQMVNSKTIDQQRWPGRLGQGNSLTRSMDFTSERTKPVGSSTIVRALQKSMIDEKSGVSLDATLKSEPENAEFEKAVKPFDNDLCTGPCATSDPFPSDTESVSSGSSSGVQECGNGNAHRPRGIMVPARFWQETNNRLRRVQEGGSPLSKNNGLKPTTKKLLNDSSILSPRGVSASRGVSSSPLRGVTRPSSPSRNAISSTSSPSRGMASPTRVRNGVTSTLSNNWTNTPSILSFAADARRGKVGENRIMDAHLLRLQYNRHLQWRFVNARADAAMLTQKVTAEKSLYNAWVMASKLRHSIKSKRIELQMLRQNSKLYSILKGQMLYLENWGLIDREHSSSLSGAVASLEASTIRLPVVGGAKADIQNLKDSICSAVDVMQSMASSICSLLTKVENVNSLASELASVTTNEHASLDQCKDLLSTLTDMQVKDCSLRTHILQLKRAPSNVITEV
ncbi:hypothetical protein LguiA_006581 [Lonicera macranthoides]